jgi:hypothetical protein
MGDQSESARELWVVEYVGHDDAWGPDPGDCHLYSELAEEHAEERRDDGDGELRVVRYVPEDSVLTAQIAVLKLALHRIRARRERCTDARSDLAPGLALAGVELERQLDELRAQAEKEQDHG